MATWHLQLCWTKALPLMLDRRQPTGRDSKTLPWLRPIFANNRLKKLFLSKSKNITYSLKIPQDSNVALRSGVYYRLIMRQSMFGRGSGTNINPDMGNTMPESSIFGYRFQKCPSAADNYVRCDSAGDYFLDQMMRWLQGEFIWFLLNSFLEGVAGATAFRADAALVVTWYTTASAISGRADIDGGQLATYQVVWLTDQAGRLSYVILNYDKLGFDAADIRMNSRSGRCQVFRFLMDYF